MTIRRRFYRVGGGGQKALSAFTLIELLVVIAIISLLVSILLPSLNRAKELANRAVCASGMRGMGLGINIYADDYDEKLPFVYNYYRLGPWLTPPMPEYIWFLNIFGIDVKDKYFPFKSMDCPSDVTREPFIDWWPYPEFDGVNLSYAYNGRYCRETVSTGGIKPAVHALSDFENPGDDILMFEKGRRWPDSVYPESAMLGCQVGTVGGTGEIYADVVGELHHGGQKGNNFLFLDAHVSYHTQEEYLKTLRYQGDEFQGEGGLGWCSINFWPDN